MQFHQGGHCRFKGRSFVTVISGVMILFGMVMHAMMMPCITLFARLPHYIVYYARMDSSIGEVDMSPFKVHSSSFSVTTVDEMDDVSSGWHDDDSPFVLPRPATLLHPSSSSRSNGAFSDRTPLISRSNKNSTSLLFGGGQELHWENKTKSSPSTTTSRPTGLSGFFFGFMYEEECSVMMEDEDDKVQLWNRLNWDLIVVYSCTTAATGVPYALIPSAATEFGTFSPALFASRATAFAVLGCACGKLLLGPAGDVFGARRVSTTFAILLSISLLLLSMSPNETCVVWACFAVECCQSVQWPCVMIILGSHYNLQHSKLYEGGIYVTSLACRCASLFAIPLSFAVLQKTSSWRVVAICGALVSLTGAIVMFMFVFDSPTKRNDPQNPIPTKLLQDFYRARKTSCTSYLRLIQRVFVLNVGPALRTVLTSGTFWIVAVAHTGSSMVKVSEHVLGTYFRDTSFGTLSSTRAGGLVVFLSFGTVLGLGIAGSIFSRRNARQRKHMVVKLYMASIGAAYTLALLAIPRLRILLGGGSSGLVLVFQVMATFVMGFGIAVQCWQIPGLVGATFGHNKGLYAAYTDGVAYGLSSGVWRIIGDAVQEGNPQGGGWAYGWAGVALMLVLCAVLMVEFIEHYFVRTCKASLKQSAGYETLIFV